jgi:hypothetical protein
MTQVAIIVKQVRFFMEEFVRIVVLRVWANISIQTNAELVKIKAVSTALSITLSAPGANLIN